MAHQTFVYLMSQCFGKEGKSSVIPFSGYWGCGLTFKGRSSRLGIKQYLCSSLHRGRGGAEASSRVYVIKCTSIMACYVSLFTTTAPMLKKGEKRREKAINIHHQSTFHLPLIR